MKCSECKKSYYHSQEEAKSSLKHQQSLGNLKTDFVTELCISCNQWVIAKKYSYSNNCKKNIYTSKAEAETVKKHSQKENGTQLNIYFCDICNGYHLTKNPDNR